MIIYFICITALAIATLGGLAYYLLASFCAYKLRQRQAKDALQAAPTLPHISLLKPLCGAEPELEACLASFFAQDYPVYEILFAVRTPGDPAIDVVNRLRRRYPEVPAKLLFTGEPPYANAKVYSLEQMAAAARYQLLAITDSDTSVAPDYLRALAQAFADVRVGVVTNLYRGVSGNDLWSRLEALGMSTEFMAGVVVAERLEGMQFALGPSMAIRAPVLQAIGGFAAMKDYLADDFVLGNWAAAAGWRVALSAHVVNHHASNEGFLRTFKHRLRWNRSARCSRPAGYFGQGFTYGSCWALLLLLCNPAWWSLALFGLTWLARGALAVQLGSRLLGDGRVRGRLGLLPLQDLLSFASWLGGLAGREIVWRNERYRLLRDGRFALLSGRG